MLPWRTTRRLLGADERAGRVGRAGKPERKGETCAAGGPPPGAAFFFGRIALVRSVVARPGRVSQRAARLAAAFSSRLEIRFMQSVRRFITGTGRGGLRIALAALRRDGVVWTACVLGGFLIYTPGYMSGDSVNHFDLAGKLDSLYIYHPPFMAYLFWIGRQFTADQSAVLLIQTLIFFGGLQAFLHASVKSPVLRSSTLLIVALFPAIFPILGVLWKSVWMTGFMLFAVAFCVRFLRSPSRFSAGAALGFVLLAMLTRYAAIAPAGVILALMAYRALRPLFAASPGAAPSLGGRAARLASKSRAAGRLAARGAAALVAGGVGVGLLGSAVGAINDAITVGTRHPSHVFLYQDILAVSVRSGVVYAPAYLRAENPGLTVERLRAAYDPTTCNAFLRLASRPGEDPPYRYRPPKTEEEAASFKTMWREAVGAHPLAYLGGRLELWRSLYGLGPKPHYPYHARVIPNKLGLGFEPTPAKEVAKAYAYFWAHEATIFHRPWLFMVIGAMIVGAAPFWRLSGATPLILLLPVAGLAHFGTLSLVACAGDFRFAFFMIVCVLLGLVVALTQRYNPAALKETPKDWLA